MAVAILDRPQVPSIRSFVITALQKAKQLRGWLMLVIPILWEAEAGRSPEVRSSRAAWPTWGNAVSTKNTKISWARWHMAVVLATREAEAGESLEPERLQCSGTIIAHYSLELLLDSNNPPGGLSFPSGWDLRPGDPRQRRHTGCQQDSFGRRGCFAGAPAWRFPVRSIRDRQAPLVPSPQGKQQLEALRTESFIASTANPGRSNSVGKGRPPKETEKTSSPGGERSKMAT
ncbi:putative uncharacterized protein C8orf44 [Plecturocebus cupreus]